MTDGDDATDNGSSEDDDSPVDDVTDDDDDSDDTTDDGPAPPLDDVATDDATDDDEPVTASPTAGPTVSPTSGPTVAPTAGPTVVSDDETDDEVVAPLDDVINDDVTDDAEPPCGCQECTLSVLNSDANGFSCGQRIDYLQTEAGGNVAELEACAAIGSEYPSACTPCNPIICDGRAPTFCGCDSCTLEVWTTLAGSFTCGARINYLQTPPGGSESEDAACLLIAQAFPAECGDCHPTACP